MKAESFRLAVVCFVDRLMDCFADWFPRGFVEGFAEWFVDCPGDKVDCFVDCFGVVGSNVLFPASGSMMGCVGGMPGCILMEFGSWCILSVCTL